MSKLLLSTLNFYIFYSKLLAQQFRGHSCFLKAFITEEYVLHLSKLILHRSRNTSTLVHIHKSEDFLDIRIRNWHLQTIFVFMFIIHICLIYTFFELCLQLTNSNSLMKSENCVMSRASSSPPKLSMMDLTPALVSRSGFTSLRAPSASLMRIWPHLWTSSLSNKSWPWDESSHYSLFWLSALYFELFWVKLS